MDTNYKPCNTKSMAAFLFAQMDKLAKKEIDTNTAVAQAKLASQINNLLNYELKRTIVQIKLKEIGSNIQQFISIACQKIRGLIIKSTRV